MIIVHNDKRKKRTAVRIGKVKCGKWNKPLWYFSWSGRYGRYGMVYFNIAHKDMSSWILSRINKILVNNQFGEKAIQYQLPTGIVNTYIRFYMEGPVKDLFEDDVEAKTFLEDTNRLETIDFRLEALKEYPKNFEVVKSVEEAEALISAKVL